MAAVLTDNQIQLLIAETKRLPDDYPQKVALKPKRGHKERELDLVGDGGSEFKLIFRESNFNKLDFSVVLAYRVPGSNQLIRLRRYNGKSHEHTNAIERQTFYDFHIHEATFRYQEDSGLREDGYAQPTDRYADFYGAVECMLRDCGFVVTENAQPGLF